MRLLQNKFVYSNKSKKKTVNNISSNELPKNGFKIFCGNLGTDVTTAVLENAFKEFKSFQGATVVVSSFTNKSLGYGFVSFESPYDMLDAIKKMNGKYVGNKPIVVRKSDHNKIVCKKKM